MIEPELSGVPRTALMMLRARADEHRKKRRLFEDPWAVDWLERLGWPRALDPLYSRWIQGKTAVRCAQVDEIVRLCIERFEVDTFVELACGLRRDDSGSG